MSLSCETLTIASAMYSSFKQKNTNSKEGFFSAQLGFAGLMWPVVWLASQTIDQYHPYIGRSSHIWQQLYLYKASSRHFTLPYECHVYIDNVYNEISIAQLKELLVK